MWVGVESFIFSTLLTKLFLFSQGWQTKQISYGGKAILIRHVLQYFPVHILSARTQQSTVLRHIQMLMADFFWESKNDRRMYHWASWKNISFPYDEGGFGMRNIQDV